MWTEDIIRERDSIALRIQRPNILRSSSYPCIRCSLRDYIIELDDFLSERKIFTVLTALEFLCHRAVFGESCKGFGLFVGHVPASYQGGCQPTLRAVEDEALPICLLT